MKIIKANNKAHLFEQISQIENCHDEIYINLRPTREIISGIVERCATAKKIYCPPSLLKQTAKNTFSFAQGKNITIIGGDFEVGRPNKYPEKTVNEIISQKQIGKPIKQISEEMGIPLRTVYFYINQKKQ